MVETREQQLRGTLNRLVVLPAAEMSLLEESIAILQSELDALSRPKQDVDPSAIPAETAAIRVDFQEWLDTLPSRLRQLAEQLSLGETTQAVAQLFHLTAGRISQIRNQLQHAWKTSQGEEVTLI